MKAADILRSPNPLELFREWYGQVQNNPLIVEPTAMTLATAGADGAPSARTVLLKQFTPEQGFAFFTNYESHKGRDLIANPKAALLFFWAPLARQIKVRGSVTKASRAESEEYWRSRPRGSQLAGWLSRQSRPVPSGQSLEKLYAAAEERFAGLDVPCPPHWGGFLLKPAEIEFWLGQPNRLHERVRFTLDGHVWRGEQLFP